MKNANTYFEEQQFRHPVLWAGIGLGGFYFFGHLLGGYFQSNTVAEDTLISCLVFALVILLFFFAKLTTNIDHKGISIAFFPFHTKPVLYRWENIQELEIITYRPLRDFGGWGIRFGFKGVKAFNVSGKDGLLVTLKNGQKRMIGTQRAKALEEYIQQSDKTLKNE